MAKQTVELDIPDGWEFVAVRLPEDGEYVLASCNEVIQWRAHWPLVVRIIVRRKLLEFWVNVYDNGSIGANYNTRKDAKSNRNANVYVRTVHMREVDK